MSACGAVYCDFSHLAALDVYGFLRVRPREPSCPPSVFGTSRTVKERSIVARKPGSLLDSQLAARANKIVR